MSYVGNTPEQRQAMLRACGVDSVEDLFRVIPPELKPKSFDLPPPLSEPEVTELFRELARLNRSNLIIFVGGGFYDHFIPAAVDALAGRSEFYTAYTPYQPEVSQGTLQAIYEYQTHICRLTEMDVANASLYDGGTALYEACQMAIHITGRNRILLDGAINPVYRKMLYSYSANLAIAIDELPVSIGPTDRSRLFEMLDSNTAALVLQNPNFFGVVDDHTDIVNHCHQQGTLVVQSVYPIALALIKTPGEMGVDIATGEGQSLGNPLAFGGPYLGFLAAKKSLVRRMPGRLVGRTVDREGRQAFVLTLQAREQHIRREKATSNICTNEALCALRAHIYLSLLGRQGFKEVGMLCHAKARYAMQRLVSIPGVKLAGAGHTFNEFVIRLPFDAGELVGLMVQRGIAPGLPLGRFYPHLGDHLLVSVTEKRTKHEIGVLAETLEAVLAKQRTPRKK
ncbi:MAG: aminomethyl-transferring glycine dehydrogenase subunit GcvPA [Kiritimatiellae bacterium]|nr:aminomethyl-transferring glycine dehydrogenase subunit GcvPA [Kiritimatiellia bacterium]